MRASSIALAPAFVACSLAACGAAPAPPPPHEAPVPVGALTTLAPPGSTFVVVADPRALMASPATAEVVLAVLDAQRLDSFAARTGIDPRALTELVLAIHPEGRVVLARGPFDAAFAVAEAGERMAPLESSVDAPRPRRAGFLGSRRIEMIALGDDTLAWVDGPPQLAAALLEERARPPARRRTAFDEHEAEELLEALGGEPFALHSPRPLGLAADTGLGLLLARERAMAFAVHQADEATLSVRAELRGEFPPGASENFVAFAHSVAASELGAAVGARDALPSLRVQSDDGSVSGGAEVPATALAAGLRALLMADMEELIEGRAPPPMRARDAPAASHDRDPHEPPASDGAARDTAPGDTASGDTAPGDAARDDDDSRSDDSPSAGAAPSDNDASPTRDGPPDEAF